MDNILKEINEYITFKGHDRMIYAKDFESVKNMLLQEMQKNEAFNKLCNGPCLGGSYADKLKITIPNEYDVIIRLKLIENRHVKIEKIKKQPGYVKINLTEVFNIIKNQKQNKIIYDQLKNLVDDNDYLVQNKLQQWVESILSTIFRQNNNKFSANGLTYNLKYSKCGPAHTIKVNVQNRGFSVDFVPSFIFDDKKWPALRKPPKAFNVETKWVAIPKPNKKAPHEPNISFQTSFVDTERYFIRNKYNFKNTLRMLKKLRDRNNIQNLKSYFIKTVFLWENDKLPREFWNSAESKVLIHMFEKLLEYVKEGNMPFYWDKRENMFVNLTQNQLDSMYNQLNCIYKKVIKYSKEDPTKMYDIFLTSDEIYDMERKKIKNNQSTFNPTQNSQNTNDQSYCIIS